MVNGILVNGYWLMVIFRFDGGSELSSFENNYLISPSANFTYASKLGSRTMT
jgi:hypothetical protein